MKNRKWLNIAIGIIWALTFVFVIMAILGFIQYTFVLSYPGLIRYSFIFGR